MRLRKLITSLTLLTAIHTSAFPVLRAQAQNREITRVQVTLEQALVMKYLADEYFLLEQRSDAQRLYKEAQRLLDDEIAPDGGGEFTETVRLLRAEIKYRLFLVGHPRMDFWGARHSLSIAAPIDSLRSLRDHMESLTRVVGDVRGEIDRLNTVGLSATDTAVNETRSEAEAKVAELQQQGAQTVEDHHEQRMEQARERLNQIVGQTRMLQQRQSQLLTQMDSVEKNLNGLVLSALSRSAGLPVDLGAVANGQSLRDTMLSAATSAAGSSEFKDALRDVHSSTTQILEVYEKANDVIQKVQQTREAIHTARDLIRKPTFDGLQRMGGIIYNRLDAQSRQRWEQIVRDARPLMPLLEVARNRPTLQMGLRRYLESAGVALPPGDITPERLEELLGERARVLAAQGEDRVKGIFDELIQGLPEADRGVVIRDLVQQNIGLAYIANNPTGGQESPDAAPGSYEQVPTPSREQGAAAMQAVFAGAVTAVFPQAAFVQIGLQIIEGINQINALADELDDIAKQMERYMVEEVHLRDLIDESSLQKALAQNNREIAIVRSRAALRELSIWNRRTDQLADISNLARRRILYRMSLLFYLAEKMREDFDRLDRSVGIWTGAMEANRGNLKKALMKDLQTIRLALDRDIHLYDWIVSEREVESRRDDVDRLFAHWEKVSQLSTDLLRDLGVTMEGGMIGDISQVGGQDGINLSRLVAKNEWEAFRIWQRQRGRLSPSDTTAKPFTLSVLIHPEGLPGEEPLLQPENGLRVVTARLGEKNSNSNVPVQTNQIRLIHPGFAYVPVIDQVTGGARYVKELYQPLAKFLDPPNPSVDRNDSFRARWRPGYSLQPFEGYGLYTTWFVQFLPNSRNYALQDVRLKFIYQYNSTVDEARVLELAYDEFFAPEHALPFKVENKYFKTLGTFQEVRAKLEKWRGTNGGTPEQPVWVYGPAVTQDAQWWRRLETSNTRPASTPLDTWLRGPQ